MWNPIESAPKDGAWLDLWVRHTDGHEYRLTDYQWYEGAWWNDDDFPLGAEHTPLFWIPAPPAPNEQSNKHTEAMPMHDRYGNYVGEWNGQVVSGPQYQTQNPLKKADEMTYAEQKAYFGKAVTD